MMKRKVISAPGTSPSSIGLGCVTFGREIDRAAAYEMMDFATAHGITLFDTAPSYGQGGSEEIIGAWLFDHPGISRKIFVSTKIQPPYNPENILDSVNQSLKRLKRDSVDLIYLHSWHPDAEKVAILKLLDDLQKSGKVKMIGASNFNTEQLGKTVRQQRSNGFQVFKWLQNNNNLAVRDIERDLEQFCLGNGIKMVTYSPLGAGFLTGKYKDGVKEGTRFSIIKGHQDIYFTEISLKRLSQLRSLSSSSGHPTSFLALVWALHRPHITSVLVGGRSAASLEQALGALAFHDAGILNELELIK